MAGDLIDAATASACGTLDDVHARTVLADHVEVGSDEHARHAVADVSTDGECFEEYLGHGDGGADVQHHAAFQAREMTGEDAEVGHAGGTDGGAVGSRALMDDIGADGRVYGEVDAEAASIEEKGALRLGELDG